MVSRVQGLAGPRIAAATIALLCALASTACSSDPATTPAPEATISVPASAPDEPSEALPSNITVSDAVPSLEALKEMGLGDEAAECFITTIDPNGTGRVESAELFMQAFASCV